MGFDFDPSEIPENMDGFDFPKLGSYHFQVNKVSEDEKSPAMIVECEILAGTPAGQEGKTHREYFYPPTADQDPAKQMATRKRTLQFFVAVGLTTEEELLDAKKAGKRVSIDEKLAVGRQFCGKLTAGKPNDSGKIYNKLGYDIWAVNSPKSEGIPLNVAMLEKNGEKPAVGGSAGGDSFGDIF